MKISFKRIFWSVVFGTIVLFYALFMWKATWKIPEVAELGIREQEIQATMKRMFEEQEYATRQEAIKAMKRIEELHK